MIPKIRNTKGLPETGSWEAFENESIGLHDCEALRVTRLGARILQPFPCLGFETSSMNSVQAWEDYIFTLAPNITKQVNCPVHRRVGHPDEAIEVVLMDGHHTAAAIPNSELLPIVHVPLVLEVLRAKSTRPWKLGQAKGKSDPSQVLPGIMQTVIRAVRLAPRKIKEQCSRYLRLTACSRPSLKCMGVCLEAFQVAQNAELPHSRS